jgi:hypothetical protein
MAAGVTFLPVPCIPFADTPFPSSAFFSLLLFLFLFWTELGSPYMLVAIAALNLRGVLTDPGMFVEDIDSLAFHVRSMTGS